MHKMKQLFACTIVAGFILTSCKSHSLIPGFEIGMSELEIRSEVNNKLATGEFAKYEKGDTIRFYYNWKLLDTSIYTRVSFNRDGVPQGKLRIEVIELTDSVTIKDLNEPLESVVAKEEYADRMLHFDLGVNLTRLVYTTCPLVKLTKSLLYLKKKYGKEDSVTYKTSANDFYQKEDTSYTLYHFHDNNSNVVLMCEKIMPPTYYIPFPHSHSAIIYRTSKSYDSELHALVEEQRSKLKPADIIKIPLDYEIEKHKDYYGYETTTIVMSTRIGIENRLTVLESRDISSIKGKLVISDTFGEVLFTAASSEYSVEGLSSEKPGIRYALGGGGVSSQSYNLNDVKVQIGSTSPESKNLRDAIAYNRKLKVEIVPEVIKFADGSLLK
jgi:hypothetical protein